MKLQTEIVQKVWTIPSNGAMEEFKKEVNEVLDEISDEDDLVNLEFHTMELGGQGVSTAYITFWTYEFDEEDEFDEDEIDEEFEEELDEEETGEDEQEVEVGGEGHAQKHEVE